jgi:hypothetical protein
MDCTKNDESNNSTVACLLVLVVTFLPSRCQVTRAGYTYTHRMEGGIYEVRRWDEHRCHEILTKFHKIWFRHGKVKGTHTEFCNLISVLYFFKVRKVDM